LAPGLVAICCGSKDTYLPDYLDATEAYLSFFLGMVSSNSLQRDVKPFYWLLARHTTKIV